MESWKLFISWGENKVQKIPPQPHVMGLGYQSGM